MSLSRPGYVSCVHRTMQLAARVTSTACRKLWNGLSRYRLATACTYFHSRERLSGGRNLAISGCCIMAPKQSAGRSDSGILCKSYAHDLTPSASAALSAGGRGPTASLVLGAAVTTEGGLQLRSASGSAFILASLSEAGAESRCASIAVRIAVTADCKCWRTASFGAFASEVSRSATAFVRASISSPWWSRGPSSSSCARTWPLLPRLQQKSAVKRASLSSGSPKAKRKSERPFVRFNHLLVTVLCDRSACTVFRSPAPLRHGVG